MSEPPIRGRFTYHPPRTPERQHAHETAREVVRDAAYALQDLLPEGRERALVLTKLEEALFWANAAIARQP